MINEDTAKESERMKRGYFVKAHDDEMGIAVIASSIKEAKKIAFTELGSDCEWIEMQALWKRQANVESLDIGIVKDGINALHHGLYDTYDGLCESCGTNRSLESHHGKAICGWCIENTEDTPTPHTS